MLNITKSWTDFKILINADVLFVESGISGAYELYAQDGNLFYMCQPNVTDELDYVTNYQSKKSLLLRPVDKYGKSYIQANSRPLGKTTCFTMSGDSSNNIGDGKDLFWDFSNDNNDITPSGVFYKKKRIVFNFIDPINIKEGSIYFQNAPKNCYIELMVVCPNGQYYINNAGTPVLATTDIVIDKFVNKHFIYGNCSLGDELNTEAASNEIPSTYKYWIEITTPNSDTTSFGYISLEIYRKRTVIL